MLHPHTLKKRKSASINMRRPRGDKTVESIERDAGLPKGSIRHKTGRKKRKDATLGGMRKGSKKSKI